MSLKPLSSSTPGASNAETPLRLDFSTAPLQVDAGVRFGNGARTNGRPGLLVFGPYWKLRAGAYRLKCVYRTFADQPTDGQAYLHVWSDSGLNKIAVKALEADAETDLVFTLTSDVGDVEFAIAVGRQSGLEFQRFELTSLTTYEAADSESVNRRDFGYNLPFKHVVSLGTHCYAASILQRIGWKRYSGPFDWIFSSPAMVRHCIEDNFQTLLDRNEYDPVPIQFRPNPLHYRCHHRFYRDTFGVQYVFNHHDVWTAEGHRYLRRCVERFLEVTSSGEPVLLLQVRWAEPDTLEQFQATVATVERHFPSCTVNAFAIRRDPAAGVCPELRLLMRSGSHVLFELSPVGAWDSTSFVDPLDELILSRVLQLHRVMVDPHLGDHRALGNIDEAP